MFYSYDKDGKIIFNTKNNKCNNIALELTELIKNDILSNKFNYAEYNNFKLKLLDISDENKDYIDQLIFMIDQINGIEQSKNRCTGCGVDMGENNPRQYCCKTYCPYENDDLNDE